MQFSAQTTATGWALFLPSVNTSMYFHRKIPVHDKLMGIDGNEAEKVAQAQERKAGCRLAFQLLWSQIRRSYSNGKYF